MKDVGSTPKLDFQLQKNTVFASYIYIFCTLFFRPSRPPGIVLPRQTYSCAGWRYHRISQYLSDDVCLAPTEEDDDDDGCSTGPTSVDRVRDSHSVCGETTLRSPSYPMFVFACQIVLTIPQPNDHTAFLLLFAKQKMKSFFS